MENSVWYLRESMNSWFLVHRKNIREHICRIVEQMVHNGIFDKFIDRFEFDMLCCEKGFEILNNLKYKEDPESV